MLEQGFTSLLLGLGSSNKDLRACSSILAAQLRCKAEKGSGKGVVAVRRGATPELKMYT